MTDAQIINRIEHDEGWPAYTNRPNDRGGPTKGGITLETFRLWRRDPGLGVADLKALERVEARAIYQFLFLQPFAAIPDGRLRDYLVDLGVLRGPRRAAMMLQDVVGARPRDGWIGAVTLAALARYDAADVRVMLIGARFVHLEQEVRDHPAQEENRDGWRNRNDRFLRA